MRRRLGSKYDLKGGLWVALPYVLTVSPIWVWAWRAPNSHYYGYQWFWPAILTFPGLLPFIAFPCVSSSIQTLLGMVLNALLIYSLVTLFVSRRS